MSTIIKNITGEISRNTLTAEISGNLAQSVLAPLRRRIPFLIPNYQNLKQGDIILSRQLTSNGHPKFSPIEVGQQLANTKFSANNCYWCHAMIYVGSNFVAELQGFYLDSQQKLRQGLRVIPLTSYKQDHLLVCRHKQMGLLGNDVANYALLNCVVNARNYPFVRVLATLINRRQWGQLSQMIKQKDLLKSITCSEFALECLAIGARCMVQEYLNVNGNQDDFYPADFHFHSDFDKIEMNYLNVTD